METPNLDRALGLHQDVKVIYCVDRYEAFLTRESDDQVLHMGCGSTIGLAILALEDDIKLQKYRDVELEKEAGAAALKGKEYDE